VTTAHETKTDGKTEGDMESFRTKMQNRSARAFPPRRRGWSGGVPFSDGGGPATALYSAATRQMAPPVSQSGH